MGREVDFLGTFSMVWDLFTFLPYFQGYLLFLSMLIIGIFWFLLFAQFYTYIRRSVMVLYIYYYQFEYFRDFLTVFIIKEDKILRFLTKRVRQFTKSSKLYNYAYAIWPLTPKLMERNLFRFLVPYLYIFDICVKNGMVSLVFYILPWMFLYTLIKSFYNLFWNIFMLRLLDVAKFFYGMDTDSEAVKRYYS